MNPMRSHCRLLGQTQPFRIYTQLALPTRSRTFTSTSTNLAQTKSQGKTDAAKAKAKRKKKKHALYKMPNLAEIRQYNLCEAMQFIRAFEAGREPSIPKYDLALRLKTKKDGPIIRNQIRLPYSVKTDIKVCVIAAPGSKQARAAKEAGAYLVGEKEVFDVIKSGKIDFDRCITTPDMLPKMTKEGLPRILGPRGLMPSVKLGTVTDDVASSVANMMGGSTYRERQGVVRMAIGQLAFTPEQLRDNIKAFITQVKSEAVKLSEANGFQKDLFEVVLSSTKSPGFSLNGEFQNTSSIQAAQLAAAPAS